MSPCCRVKVDLRVVKQPIEKTPLISNKNTKLAENGDTLWSISKQFHVKTWLQIHERPDYVAVCIASSEFLQNSHYILKRAYILICDSFYGSERMELLIKHWLHHHQPNFSTEKNLIWDALRDMVPFVQFKKHKRTPVDECYFWWSCRACNFTKSNTSPWVFFTFLNCKNGTKSRKASHIEKYTTLIQQNNFQWLKNRAFGTYPTFSELTFLTSW